MATTWTWNQIITNIEGISTKTTGSSSQTGTNKWGIDTVDGAWLYIPANGYYTTGHWLNIPWNTVKTKLGNAGDGHVLNGIRYSSENGIYRIGSMTNRGKVTHTFTPSDSAQTYTIPAGYHNGTGVITCNKVALSGNADTGHVLSGYTFYKDNMTKKTGTIATKGALNWKPGSGTTATVDPGYYSGGTLDSRDAYNKGKTDGYNDGYNVGKNESSVTSAYGTFTFGSTGRDTITSIQCGFRPDIIIGHTTTYKHGVIVYLNGSVSSSGVGLNAIYRSNDSASNKDAIPDCIAPTDNGFNINGEVDYMEHKEFWYVAVKVL